VVFLHGGPGGGTSPSQRRFFHPERYRVVLFDQRGCGKSTPPPELGEHDLGTWSPTSSGSGRSSSIERWQVFGGSWGSTLALAYAQKHPARVTELVLRGIFLLRRQEIEWFYQRGASALFPDLWAGSATTSRGERGDFLGLPPPAHARDRAVRVAAASAGRGGRARRATCCPDPHRLKIITKRTSTRSRSRASSPLLRHRGFLETDEQLLRDVPRIRHIPAVIVQAATTSSCPAKRVGAPPGWPEAELVITRIPATAFDAANSGRWSRPRTGSRRLVQSPVPKADSALTRRSSGARAPVHGTGEVDIAHSIHAGRPPMTGRNPWTQEGSRPKEVARGHDLALATWRSSPCSSPGRRCAVSRARCSRTAAARRR
jgi:proline iminopeptidase